MASKVPNELGAETVPGPVGRVMSQPVTNYIQQARNATVFIRTPWGSGSGFFVDGLGRIVTNRHVVELDEKQLDKLRRKISELGVVLDEEKKILKRMERDLEKVHSDNRPRFEQIRQRRQAQYDKYLALREKLQEQLRDADYYSPFDRSSSRVGGRNRIRYFRRGIQRKF